ncbi:hypothetical protein BV898_04020 [Hypsibius exemplaris]|uniref:Uncharacterized protein n=1 Tax=Hypsibius exemplaris TaxID=2072580 RepID=A0A1W0X3W2_HYPEX|nr:hypothetical protein BV898_04020 [Hypsibius exemplaris]
MVTILVVALTELVRLQIQDAKELLRHISAMGEEKLSGASKDSLLIFRKQCRTVTHFATELNKVLSPLIMVMMACDVAAMLGGVTWLFNPVLLTEPLRHLCWLAFVVLRGVLVAFLCIQSTETADNLLSKQREMSLAYDEHWATRDQPKRGGYTSITDDHNNYALGKGLLDSSLMGIPAVAVGLLGNMRKQTVFAVLSTCVGLVVFLYETNQKA